jgi:hypothetical protein
MAAKPFSGSSVRINRWEIAGVAIGAAKAAPVMKPGRAPSRVSPPAS